MSDNRTSDNRTKELSEKAAALESRLQGLTGELARRDQDIASLTKKVSELEDQIKRTRANLEAAEGVTAEGLRDGEAQLRDSVTFTALTGTARANGGDVVTTLGLERAAEIQKGLGTGARAYALAHDALEELRNLKLLRG